MKRYRAGIIGHTGRGNYGHSLDLAFGGLLNVDVVAVADSDEAGRSRALQRTGAAEGYARYTELLERERPDVLAVCTRWPDQHEAMIMAAVNAGVKGIFCEKPLASAPEEADRILAACDARNVKLTIAHHNRVRPAPRAALRLVQEGAIGRLRVIRAFGKSDRRSGGEDMLVLGTHLMDLMRHFAGDARWCSARVTYGSNEAGTDEGTGVTYAEKEEIGPLLGDDVIASFGFDNGVTGTFESTRAADGGAGDYYHLELCGTAGMVAFRASPGSPVWHLPAPFVVPGGDVQWVRHDPPAWPEVPGATPPPADANAFFHSNRALAADLLEAIEEDRPTVSDGRDAAASLEMISAVYASHLSGERVALPLVERTHPLARLEQRARATVG